MNRLINNIQELEEEALRFVNTLVPEEQATLITLSGELGAGKTAFTKALAKAWGIEEHITSPTFVLEKIYQLPKGAVFARLAHIDAYRLKDGSELAALGFDELMSSSDTVVVLEWPEKVADALPEATHHIILTAEPDGSRTLSYA